MNRASIAAFAAFAVFIAMAAPPAQAEVIKADDSSFITHDEVVVEADPKAVWLALISPAKWWNSLHTWSGDAANLTLTPQAGGCFCEKIPEVDEPDRFTLEGSVEHMRIIQANPEVGLRMVGALGPLQTEPVTGVLTIALTKVETSSGPGTRIVWEYYVGGAMRYEVPVISKAVDGVMSLQLAGLGKLLGVAAMPEAVPKPDAGADDAAAAASGPDDSPAVIEPEDTLDEASADAPAASLPEKVSNKPSAVDEAFRDLSDADKPDVE